MAAKPAGYSLGNNLIAGADLPGTFELVTPDSRVHSDARTEYINFHTSHTGHLFSARNESGYSTRAPSVVPFNDGWLVRTEWVYAAADPHFSFVTDQWQNFTCYSANGTVLWETRIEYSELGVPNTGTGIDGAILYRVSSLVTGNQNSRALFYINRFADSGLNTVGGADRYNHRYLYLDFDGSGNPTITHAFDIIDTVDPTVENCFAPTTANTKTYISGSGYVVCQDMANNDKVLCVTGDLEYVAEIKEPTPSFAGRYTYPNYVGDDRVNIRRVTPNVPTAGDASFAVWSITFDGVSAPSISHDFDYVLTGVNNDWFSSSTGFTELTSWNEGAPPKSPEFWHAIPSGPAIDRPNYLDLEADITGNTNSEGFTVTPAASFGFTVIDWYDNTPLDSPYNGDNYSHLPFVNRMNYVNYDTSESGFVDYQFVLAEAATHNYGAYMGYYSITIDDAASYMTNPHTNRAWVWQFYVWQMEANTDGIGAPGGRNRLATYVVVQYGESAAPPATPAWVNFFNTGGISDPDCPMLGSGSHQVFLYDRGGARMIGQVGDTTLVRWSRIRDDISTATVMVSQPSPECVSVLRDMHGGRHEIVIYRDGARVWEGPITRSALTAGGAEITAADINHYLSRTIMHNAYDNRYSTNGSKVAPVTLRAQVILMNELIRKEALNPSYNILRFLDVRTHANTTRTSRFTYAYQQSVWEELDYMAAKLSLDYTAVGRRLLINDVHDVIGRTQLLTDKDFNSPLIITSYVMELATRSAVTDGEGHWAAVGGIDDYYGEVELLNSTYGEEVRPAGETPTAEELKALMTEMTSQAQRNMAGRYPLPTVVRVPDNTRLDPSAPVTIDELVPGVRIPIRATQTIMELQQEQKLDKLVVEETPSGETVSITLSPAPGTTPWDDEMQIGDEGDG